MDLLCNKELKEEQSPNKQSMNKLQEPERLSRPPGMLPSQHLKQVLEDFFWLTSPPKFLFCLLWNKPDTSEGFLYLRLIPAGCTQKFNPLFNNCN